MAMLIRLGVAAALLLLLVMPSTAAGQGSRLPRVVVQTAMGHIEN